MSYKDRSPVRRSNSLVTCGFSVLAVIIIAVLVSLILSSCRAPSGGPDNQCHWERERVKPQGHTLTGVNLTRTYLQAGFKPRPRPPVRRPASRYVKPGKRTERMPVRKAPKPRQTLPQGYKWEWDCD